MADISIVCCYNNEHMYKEILIQSLNRQSNRNFEIIGINNSTGKYSSCASALNYAIAHARGKYIIAVHQDFEFLSNESIDEIENFMNNASENDVYGVAGAIVDKNAGLFKKIICRNQKNITSFDEDYVSNIERYGKKVETLDECCVCFNRKLWEKHNFSEKLCFAWDLYAVELCLYAKNVLGASIRVIPIKAIHHSDGNLSTNFYKSLYKISNEYKNIINQIVTTCVVVKTKYPKFICMWLIFINILRLKIKAVKG